MRDGQVVECDPRVLDLLHLLIAQREGVVSRDQLIEALWPGRMVSDASLSQLIRRARQLLEDDGKSPRYIQTVHGRGFRWLAPVEEITADETQTTLHPPEMLPHGRPGLPRWLAPALLLLLIVVVLFQNGREKPAETSTANQKLALLPFDYPQDNVQYSWVSLGLMEMVAEMLANTPRLQLVPGRKVVSWLQAHPDAEREPNTLLTKMCVDLGCDRILVTRISGDPIPDTLEAHWLGRDGPGPTLRLQGNDLTQLARKLALRLAQPHRPDTRIAVDMARYSSSPQANQAYALALEALHQDQWKLARQYLQIAVGQAPDFAMALAHLSKVEERLGDIDLAHEHLQQVLGMKGAPWQARYLALLTLGNIQYSQGKLEESLRTTRTMLESPDWPMTPKQRARLQMNMGTTLQRLNRLDEARHWLLQSEQTCAEQGLQTLQTSAWFNLGNVALSGNHLEEAMRWYQKAEQSYIQLGNEQNALIARFQIATIYKSLGHLPEAIRLFEQLARDSKKLGDIEGVLLARIEYLDSSNRHHPEPDRLIESLPRIIQQAESRQMAYPAHLARNQIAYACWQKKQPEKGLQWLKMNSELARHDFNTQMIHALLLWQNQQLQAALESAHRARSLAGDGFPAGYQQWLIAMEDARDQGLDYARATAGLAPPVPTQ